MHFALKTGECVRQSVLLVLACKDEAEELRLVYPARFTMHRRLPVAADKVASTPIMYI